MASGESLFSSHNNDDTPPFGVENSRDTQSSIDPRTEADTDAKPYFPNDLDIDLQIELARRLVLLRDNLPAEYSPQHSDQITPPLSVDRIRKEMLDIFEQDV